MGFFDSFRRQKRTAGPLTSRLADPAHPGRKQLDQVARIVDQCVEVELTGERTALKASFPVAELEKALSALEEAIARCPDDMDLQVAKASLLHASAQFKSAEETLDLVLTKNPDHFEAKMWKGHWRIWSDALRFPRWGEGQASLHPVMAAHLGFGHRVQLVRDGLQKAVAIVAPAEGPPFDSRTQLKVAWVLSQTPVGPLVAYYVKIIEPSGEPSTMEAFLPIFQPTFAPLEGYCLVQQLAFTPYCFIALVNGTTVTLNRRLVLGPKAATKLVAIASQLSSAPSYLPQPQFKAAMQWHMGHFDMKGLTFD